MSIEIYRVNKNYNYNKGDFDMTQGSNKNGKTEIRGSVTKVRLTSRPAPPPPPKQPCSK